MKKRLDVVGKARRRVDGRSKVTGALRFADDLSMPRMLHAKLLRSPHPHAVIEQIDIEKAKKHPGVHLVLDRQGLPGAVRHHAGRRSTSIRSRPSACATSAIRSRR